MINVDEYNESIRQLLNKDTIEEAIDEYKKLSDDDRIVLNFMALTTREVPDEEITGKRRRNRSKD